MLLITIFCHSILKQFATTRPFSVQLYKGFSSLSVILRFLAPVNEPAVKNNHKPKLDDSIQTGMFPDVPLEQKMFDQMFCARIFLEEFTKQEKMINNILVRYWREKIQVKQKHLKHLDFWGNENQLAKSFCTSTAIQDYCPNAISSYLTLIVFRARSGTKPGSKYRTWSKACCKWNQYPILPGSKSSKSPPAFC